MKTQKAIILLLLIVATFLSGCGPLNQPDEEEAVYRAFLDHYFNQIGSVYVIDENTYLGEYNEDVFRTILKPIKNDQFSLNQETIDDFILNNSASQKLLLNMNLGNKYILITQSEKDEILKKTEDGWKLFRERYPDSSGIMSLSHVGFNKAQTQALLMYNFSFVGNSGEICVLEKVSGIWVWKGFLVIWMS